MVEALLAHTSGLDAADFDLITTEDDATSLKPSPEIFYRALASMGLDAGAVIAFEDRPVNQTAALEAGLQCYLYPGEYAPLDSNVLVTRDPLATLERTQALWADSGLPGAAGAELTGADAVN